jgi:hypothetical protein
MCPNLSLTSHVTGMYHQQISYVILLTQIEGAGRSSEVVSETARVAAKDKKRRKSKSLNTRSKFHVEQNLPTCVDLAVDHQLLTF